MLSVLVWAPIDTAFSIHFGVRMEALFNLGAVVEIVLPLIATYRSFFPRSGSV